MPWVIMNKIPARPTEIGYVHWQSTFTFTSRCRPGAKIINKEGGVKPELAL